MIKIQLLLTSLFLLIFYNVSAQNMPSRLHAHDSTETYSTYPYMFPILGEKLNQRGIKLPLPAGIMINALTGKQNLTLTDLSLGFGNSNNPNPPEMINVDDFIKFDDISAQTSTFNMRLDAWLLPFLNVYGIVGQTKKAEINVNLTEPFPLEVTTGVSGTYVGFGVMAAGALGKIFVSADLNRTYNFNPRLNEPAKVIVSGLRTGPVFRFGKKEEMNVTFWIGTMFTGFNGATSGQINTIELAPDAPARVDEMQAKLDEKYNSLSPIDKIKYQVLYNKLTDGLTSLKNGIETSYIRYDMNKSIEHPWNMLVGGQWQINYRWQVRTEAQFLGDRIAGMFSVNFRFGIRGKNWLSGQTS